MLNVTVRRGLARAPDVDAGSAVIASVALVLVAAAAVASGSDLDPGELWPFVLLGAFVPGLSQLLVVRAVRAAGASRAGILFGMTPLFSASIAIVAFGEPLRWPLAAGTLLVVAGGVSLAWESDRPSDYRAYGAALAVTVAAAFGLRDNVARSVGGGVTADGLAQATAIMLGASILGFAWRIRVAGGTERQLAKWIGATIAWSCIVLGIGVSSLASVTHSASDTASYESAHRRRKKAPGRSVR